MKDIKLKRFILSKEITLNLPLYYNFIRHNELVPEKVEAKSLYYSERYDNIMAAYPSDKPISKIVNLSLIDNLNKNEK